MASIMIDMTDRRGKIRALNDEVRTQAFSNPHLIRSLYRLMLTPACRALPPRRLQELTRAIEGFNAFDADNDPRDEHDFGIVAIGGRSFYFKIDYYDLSLEFGSPDPADPLATIRVLTIMRADEY
jgi:hypothetical protein